MINREGFFYSKHEPRLPRPVPNEKPWKGKADFLLALAKKETDAQEKAYKGSSTCRVCGDRNGSSEFRLTWNSNIWVWPEGFAHYVKKHNVRPSLAFQEFILDRSLSDKD